MKRISLGLFAAILAIGASAFTTNTNNLVDYFWYDAETLELLNEQPTSQIPTGCDQVNQTPCAFGHESQTSTPDVNPDITVRKP